MAVGVGYMTISHPQPTLTPVPRMSRISDLVRDSKLSTEFTSECTTHTFFGSTLVPGKRRSRRQRQEERWTKSKRLGHGSFGVVWLEECVAGRIGRLRAVKEIRKETVGFQEEEYNRELEAIAKFSHTRYDDFFVRSFGWFESPESVFIAMEYIRHGDLQQYLNQPLAEEEAKQIVCQILEGLECMHDNGFAHRDLKPKNLFVVTRGPNWWVKIGDFGLSKRVERGTTVLKTINGTPGYIAPEILEQMLEVDGDDECGYTFTVDLWSLGVTTFYILTGKLPFPRNNDLLKYARGDSSMEMLCAGHSQISQDATSFLKCIMAAMARDRGTAEEALRHPWLQSVQQTSLPGSPLSGAKASTPGAMSELGLSESSSESEVGPATWTTRVTSRSSSRMPGRDLSTRRSRVTRSRSRDSIPLIKLWLEEDSPSNAERSSVRSEARHSLDSYTRHRPSIRSPPRQHRVWNGELYAHTKCFMRTPDGCGWVRMDKDLIRPEVLLAYKQPFHVKDDCLYIEGELLQETLDFYVDESWEYTKPQAKEILADVPPSAQPRSRKPSPSQHRNNPESKDKSAKLKVPRKGVRFDTRPPVILEGPWRRRETIPSHADSDSDSRLSSWNLLHDTESDNEELEWNRSDWDTQVHTGAGSLSGLPAGPPGSMMYGRSQPGLGQRAYEWLERIFLPAENQS
ncbi:uncharacterized protein N7515_005395 [Penicillium bovifimosum]|uniref:Protein kinase domain-containing protein n=1 Tax=Penicillium bovifimosum TaxID=126998 RepID=A0A9W9GTX1_9EURO|nr:uncharacterized protein N7515_005395 [Penicillium bovifimosum]KAJ5129356.1 hypothetical protein N7515_005395 [Penicillium bovifimosum]